MPLTLQQAGDKKKLFRDDILTCVFGIGGARIIECIMSVTYSQYSIGGMPRKLNTSSLCDLVYAYHYTCICE